MKLYIIAILVYSNDGNINGSVIYYKRGLMAPKIKIEDTLDSGEKISIILEGGELDEEKIIQVIQMIKAIKYSSKPHIETTAKSSLKDRLWASIIENFGDGTWFSIKDLYNVAKKEIEGLKITSVSTYVTRFVAEGRLVKKGSKPNTRYRVKTAVQIL